MNIAPVANTVNRPASIITRFTNSAPVRNTVSKLGKNAPMILVISVVSKDLVGALVLFYQTFHNKRIPEKKRKYLAAYELTSGSYNVIFPLTVGALITTESFKYKTAKMLFKKYHVSQEELKNATGEAKEALLQKMKIFKKCNSGLAKFVAVVFTAIISKRIICPFVGGPMATVFNEKVLQRHHDTDKA